MAVKIMVGDCREVLRALPAESAQCVVTSPPYWGLRDYGVAGQLGMEASLGEYLGVMVDVFREVRRVLRKDGTLWLNLGDSYAASPNGRSAADVKALGNDDRTFRDKPFSTIGPVYNPNSRNEYGGKNARRGDGEVNPGGRIEAGGYLKPKDLCGIPWRVAFALQEDGWWLRQDIIWSKPNPLPESVTDRCTKAHEYIFLLSKSERYYFDAEAIKEPASWDQENTKMPDGWDMGFGGHGSFHREGSEKGATKRTDKQRGHGRCHAGFSERWDAMKRAEQCAGTRNKRSVWTIGTHAFPEAHFATFPPALIEPCVLAGCPKGGTVIDPFGGAGTTGLVADRLGRNAVLIELNPEYAAMAERRIRGDAGMFAEVDSYDGLKDFAGSLDVGYEAIRARVANGGPGWTPKDPTS